MKKNYLSPKIVSLEVSGEHSLASGSIITSRMEIDPMSSKLEVENWQSDQAYTDSEFTLTN